MRYYRHFGLRRDPFAPAPDDPAMCYPALGHADCAARLTLALTEGHGLALVFGEAGYGKTAIIAALLHTLGCDGGECASPRYALARIAHPRAYRADVPFLRALLAHYGLPSEGRTGGECLHRLRQFFAALSPTGRRALLVIDDGHDLTGTQLELLRLMLTCDPPAAPAIDIAVFARRALAHRIGHKPGLARCVTTEHWLNPLNRRDTAGLIAHRLTVAGLPAGASLFTESAIAAIHAASGGVPGAIIAGCARCLTEAVFRDHAVMDAPLVEAVMAAMAAARGVREVA